MACVTTNPNFYLEVNKQVGFWEEGELKLLCKALRFPEDLIVNYASQWFQNGRISTNNLRSLVHQQSFFRITDCSFNNHSADFNVPALTRSIEIIEARLATFAELNSIFLAYVTYELPNMSGLPANIDTLLDTFKLCGKTISPTKLKHRLKHARDQHARQNTIQFHEFLNLMLWSIADNFPVLPELCPVKERNKLGLYSVDSPTSYLVPAAERVQHDLDKQYITDELSYLFKKVRIGPPPIAEKKKGNSAYEECTSALVFGAGISDEHIKQAKAQGAVVQNEVSLTEQERKKVKAGFEHTRTISKQWVVRETSPKPSSSRLSPTASEEGRSSRRDDTTIKESQLKGASASEMYAILQEYMRERERRLNGAQLPDIEIPKQQSNSDQIFGETKSRQPLMENLVTNDDILETQEAIKNMKIEYAFMQRRRLLQNPVINDDEPPKGPERRPVDQLISELYNPPPLKFQAHDQQCDSKKRNPGQLKGTGHHFLLTEPCYDEKSPGGRHLANVHNELIGHGKFRGKGIRFANGSDVVRQDANQEAAKLDDNDQTEMRGRLSSLSRLKTPAVVDNSWMNVFFGRVGVSHQTAVPVDFEQYYSQKLIEFGIKPPQTPERKMMTS